MKAILTGLALLVAGCSQQGTPFFNPMTLLNYQGVIKTVTDNKTFYKEWIDKDGDGKVDLITNTFICNGVKRGEPSFIYDLRSNIVYVDRPLYVPTDKYEQVIMNKDLRCRR